MLKEVLKTDVDLSAIGEDALSLYLSGDFNCAESVTYTIRKHIDPTMPEGFIAACTGFGMGVGGSKCMCGSVTGGVVCLGYFFGRKTPTTLTDPSSQKTLTLAKELYDYFKENHGSLCCHVHLKKLEHGTSQQRQSCGNFVKEVAIKIAQIVIREKGGGKNVAKRSLS